MLEMQRTPEGDAMSEESHCSDAVVIHDYLVNSHQIMAEALIEDALKLCMCCRENEATEQLPNESGLYVCYGCKIAQREVIP